MESKLKNFFSKIVITTILLLSFVNSSNGQSVTASNKANFSSITVTNCGGNIWKVKAYQANQWAEGSISIYYGGTIIGSCAVNSGCWNNSLKYTTNQFWSATNDGSFAMSGHAGRWVYIEVNTSAKTANTRADWTCTSCTQPTNPTSITGTTTICSGGTTTLTASGGSSGSGATFQWGTGTTVGSGTIVQNTTSASYTTPTLTSNQSYWVRRIGTTTGCTNTTGGVSTTITVNPVSVGGSISGTATVCSGSNSGTLTLSGHTGSILKWQSSTNGGTTWSDITNTSTTQNYTNLTTTTRYRAVVQSGVCSSTNSSEVTITVSPATVSGSISGSTSVCSGTNSGTLTLSGHTGSIVKWQSSINGGTTWVDISNTSTTQSYTNLTTTTQYRTVVQSGSCSSVNTTPVTITVNPVSVGGSISGTATVCSGTNSGTLTLSGHTGSILKWQSSTNGGTTWNDISNTSTTQSYTNLTTTTQYRAVVQSGTCGSTTSLTTTITVSPVTVSGSISGSTTVCSGTNSGTLTLSGHTGSIVKWQSSTNGGTTWSDISNTSTTQSYTNLTTTTQYRTVVQSGSCSLVNTTPVTITVDPVSVGGSISGTATVCSGTNSGTLTLSGHTGSIVKWQSSTNGGTTWSDISNTSTTQNYTNLTTTTKYRAVVQSGVCSSTNSSEVTITVDPVTVSGTLSGSNTVCSGTNSGTLTLSGHTGSIVKWQSSTNGGTTWVDISNTSTTQNYTNLTTTTQYRAVVQSGSCSLVNTTPVTITVNPVSVGGSISGTATVCSGSNSGTLTLSGHTGSIVKWQSSTNSGTTWVDISNTSTTQNYTNLTTTTQYRTQIQSGSCSSVNTTPVTITVDPVSVSGTLSGSSTVCNGDNSGNINLSGNTGSVVKWQSSTDNGNTWNDISNTSTTQSYTNLTTTTKYRTQVQSGSCSSVFTSPIDITVYDVLLPGTILGNQTICSNVTPDKINSVTLPTGGNGIYTYQWQYSTDNISWSNIPGATEIDYSPGALSSSTYYRRVVTSGSCVSVYTSTFVKVNTCNGPGGVSGDITLWLRSDDGIVGEPISTWLDKSGNEKNATTTLGNPSKLGVSRNFNPSVSFDGSSGFSTDSVMIEHMFVVVRPNENLSTSSEFQIIGRKNHNSSSRARVFGFGNKSIKTSTDSSTFATPDRIRINGKTNISLSTNFANVISVDAENKGGVRDVYNLGKKSEGTSYNNLNGEISEVICFGSKKTGLELAKIESYLSIKYGITISNEGGGTNGNYYNSNGDLIWNASNNSTYHKDVIGIGKDNTQQLNQKQSKTNDGKLILFVSNLVSDNSSNTGNITNDRSFIMVGHNNGLLKSDSIIDLESPSEIKHRLAREWKITNTNFDDNFNIEIEWDSSGTFDLSKIRLLVDDDGDFTNANVYGTADGLNFRLGSIIVEDVNSSFIPKGSTKYITIGSVDELTVLPIQLLSFYGVENNKTVDIHWETASEINTDYFEILHSIDGINYKSIGKINAANYSNVPIKYQLTHYIPSNGVNYYKLVEYDMDGHSYSFGPKYVNFEYVGVEYDFIVYPNPITGSNNLYLRTNYLGDISFNLFDMNGKLVRSGLVKSNLSDFILIDDLNIQIGVYNLVISSPDNSFNTKVIKVVR